MLLCIGLNLSHFWQSKKQSYVAYMLGQKSWKNFVGFLEDLKTPKGHFEID